jgi:molecular chaperone DnaK (HSP70)
MTARYLVGIDLGTTTTVVAAARADTSLAAGAVTDIFPMRQRVSAGEVEALPRLASVLYIPTEDEKRLDPLAEGDYVLGAYARTRGAEVPGRAITSAKSWLSYPRIDRTAAVLPWGRTDEELPRLSPVDASARLLARVRSSWDEAHPDAPLHEQTVVLTVPASFDEAARELTLLAAGRAGLSVRLLEEPQAALYEHLGRDGRAALAGGLVLVVDIGGGTTDLSLVRVPAASAGAGAEIERVAVGRHLLLGGDNMDLALASLVESRFGAPVDAASLEQLALACRQAKEALFAADDPAATAVVTLAGRGSALVGGTKRAVLARADLDEVLVEPFFPRVDRMAATASRPPPRAALVTMGLPYERDPAITRHVAAFLERYAPGGREPVTSLLLNGGVFRAEALAERLVEVVTSWSATAPVRLVHPEPDLAVARGAVAYARALAGQGTLIGSGTAFGYYVASQDDAGRPVAVSVVPRGAREGVRHVATDRVFALTVGRPVRFELYAATDAAIDAPGTAVALDRQRLRRLPPLVLAVGDGTTARETAVTLEGELSAIGTLDLACVETSGSPPARYRLAFDLRAATETGQTEPPPKVALSQPPHAVLLAHTGETRARFDRAFRSPADASAREIKDLVRDLEKLHGERNEWTTATARALFDLLVPHASQRRKTEAHERTFWMLAGFCLRPGFGDPLDPGRIARLTPALLERLAFQDGPRNWQAYFVAARRIAAGLAEPTQLRLRDTFDPFLAPSDRGLKKPKKVEADSLGDLRATLASFERVPSARRAELGDWLVERTFTDADPALWSELGRIGARVPAYASVHHVIAPGTVERWLDLLLRGAWEKVPTAERALVDLARRTGDRARDLSADARKSVLVRLQKKNASPDSLAAVTEVVEVAEKEREAFYGESLPVGLRLVR